MQGRSSPAGLVHPIEVPPGDWALTLAHDLGRTGLPRAGRVVVRSRAERRHRPARTAGPSAGKRHSPVEADASRLATERGEAVRVLWSREDVVRLGPKRPPVAGGVGLDGSGVLRVGAPAGRRLRPGRVGSARRTGRAVRTGHRPRAGASAPDHRSPSTSAPRSGRRPPRCRSRRGSVARPAAQRLSDVPVEVTGPTGGRAVATCRAGRLDRDRGGRGPGRSTRSCCAPTVSAPRTRLSGWVRSEGIAVDESGVVHDLTIRSFGILQARAMPRIDVVDRSGTGNGRSTGPTRCSPRSPRPGGWPTGCRRCGRPTARAVVGVDRPRRGRSLVADRSHGLPAGPNAPA